MAEILAALKIAEAAYALAKGLYEAAKAKGDPTTDEVIAQMARSQAAIDDLDAIVNGTA